MCVYLSVCLSLAAFPQYCMDPGVTWVNGRGCPVVVHCWADLQSMHGFRCYGNIAPNTECQPVLVQALCLVMAALRSRCGHNIFALWFFLSSSSVFFFLA